MLHKKRWAVLFGLAVTFRIIGTKVGSGPELSFEETVSFENGFFSSFKPHLQTRQFSRSLKGMTVTLDMPKEIEAQFTAGAQARGVPLSDYVRDFIVEHYQEDADDLRTAQERLADPQPGTTSNQLRKNLGLDG